MGSWNQKKIGEYIEKIDFANDPNIYLFYKHMITGLLAFANQQQTADESFTKYKVMLRLAEGFISSKYGINFYDLRKKIKEQTKNETEALEKEVMLIGQILDMKTRKVEVKLIWNKKDEEEAMKEFEEDFITDDENETDEDFQTDKIEERVKQALDKMEIVTEQEPIDNKKEPEIESKEIDDSDLSVT